MSKFVRALGKPTCRYGDACYQQGRAHWQAFDHPDTHPRLAANDGDTMAKRRKVDEPAPSPALAKAPVDTIDFGGDTDEDEPNPSLPSAAAKPPSAPPDDDDDGWSEEAEVRRLEGLPPPNRALDTNPWAAPDEPADVQAVPADVQAAPAPSEGAGSSSPDPLGPLADNESTMVQGSGANMYELKRVGATYSCSCPSWRNQKGAGSMRTCKHLKALRGEAAELARLGGDSKAYFATGNRVVGQGPAAGTPSGASAVNLSVVKSVALADSWDSKRDLSGWALSEKLDGMRCLWDGNGGCFSRAGKDVHVPASLCAQLPVGTALDGLGALQLRLRNGKGFNCGTGFTDHEREHPPAVGSVVTFQYFELTDGGIPRFPRYLRVRPDVDASEFAP